MTTIGIAPIGKTRGWFEPDSATMYETPHNDMVDTSDILSMRPIVQAPRETVEFRLEIRSRPEAEAVPLQETAWFRGTIDALGALPWNTDHWSSGATRTQPAAIAKLLQVLLEILDVQSPAPQVVPTWRGGVQAEWHCNDVDFEIEVDPRGHVDYFFKSPLEEHEGRVGHPSQLTAYARAVNQG